MGSILVTTDLSPESSKAFSTALKYAKAFESKVVLLSVIEDPAQAAVFYAMDFNILPDPGIRAEILKKVQSELSALAQQHFSAVQHDEVVRETTLPVYQEILSYADSISADLIILATHGRTGLRHLLIGSTAERVARESKHPVLIVPVK